MCGVTFNWGVAWGGDAFFNPRNPHSREVHEFKSCKDDIPLYSIIGLLKIDLDQHPRGNFSNVLKGMNVFLNNYYVINSISTYQETTFLQTYEFMSNFLQMIR